MLTSTAVLPGLHASIFSMTRALQTVFQLKSEGENVILKKNSTEIRSDKKMVNKFGEGFLLTTNFHNSANKAAILVPKKQKP